MGDRSAARQTDRQRQGQPSEKGGAAIHLPCCHWAPRKWWVKGRGEEHSLKRVLYRSFGTDVGNNGNDVGERNSLNLVCFILV